MDAAFTIEDCIHDAIERVGGQAATASEIRSARRSLRLLFEEWAALRLNTWRRDFVRLRLPSADGSHVLPTGVDDVLDVLICDGDDKPETQIDRVSFAEFVDWPSKAQSGRPTAYFVERTEPPRIYFRGLGAAGQTAIVWCATRPTDWAEEAPSRWLPALVTGLAFDLAQKRRNPDGTLDEVLIARLEKSYAQRLDLCSRNDRDRVSFRVGVA